MHPVLKEMADVVQKGPGFLKTLKARNKKKMIGYFFPVFPGEILHAAGIHPVQLYPSLGDPITLADDHLQTFLCGYVRAQWDQVLKGVHGYLDGVILPRSCEAVTFLYQTWRRHNPFDFIDHINIPWKKTPDTLWFFRKELERVKENVGSFVNREITGDVLRDAITIFNKNRALLREAFKLAKNPESPFSNLDGFHMVMSGFFLDKTTHNELLEELLNGAPHLKGFPAADPPQVRLLLSGGCVLDTRLLETITGAGAVAPVYDCNNGQRSFCTDVSMEKDPLEALAAAYARTPCGFNTAIEDRFSYIKDLVSQSRAKGVLFAINRNCETEKFDYPLLDQKIRKELGIPTILIETDYLCAMGPLRTRIEAFVEMIRDNHQVEENQNEKR